jgi:hypothetical protein
VIPQVLSAPAAVAEGQPWQTADMTAEEGGVFSLPLDAVASSFKYRVIAGSASSPVFHVTAARPPRVTRVDVEYSYPEALGLPGRIEEDSGDVYAPAGTNVRLRVHTEPRAATGHMALADGRRIPLSPQGDGVLSGGLAVAADGSYRIALADLEGLNTAGDTEYFIRTLQDRPPDVRVLRPARDRTVTRLEEVDIVVEAEDDFGIDRLELVYAVRGGPDKVVSLAIPRGGTSARGIQTLYLEDLHVQPGDFVSYQFRVRPREAAEDSSTISSPPRKTSSSPPGSSIDERNRRARSRSRTLNRSHVRRPS